MASPLTPAELDQISCATARRGGQRCADEQCECLDCTTLLERADELLARALASGALSTIERAAAEDWRIAYEQSNSELQAVCAAPADLRQAVSTLVEPPGLSRADLADVDRLAWLLRPDEHVAGPPAPRALVLEALEWVRRNLCRPAPGEVER